MPQRCLYDVLGIDKTSDDADIKKAYRKQALVWHPDKNQHRIDEAHAVFQEIQNAYEVLSDKHERAWYDSHRDQILRSGERHQAGGGADFTPGQRPDDEPDLYQFFTASCFSGFGDGPKGFYGVYSNLFSMLAEQELTAWQQTDAAGAPNATPPKFAPFGTSDSPSADVFAFYSNWSSFVTSKEFAWADKYNPAAAPNRQVRRKMEDENRKSRRVARREYLDNVRELVAFVKKRDKRVAKAQAEEAARRAEQQAAEAAKRAAEREERLRRAAEYQEPEWVRASEAAQQEEETTEESEEDIEEHYCVVCEKRFRSAGQLANHERSKKHLEAVAELRQLLEEEEQDTDWLLNEAEKEAASQQQQPPKAKGEKGKRNQQQQRRMQQMQQQQQQQAAAADSSSEAESEDQEEAAAADEAPAAAAAADAAASSTGSSSSSSSEESEEQEGSASEGDLDEDELLARMVSKSRASSSTAKQKHNCKKKQQQQEEDEGSDSGEADKAGSSDSVESGEGEQSDGEGEQSVGEEEQSAGEEAEEAMLARLASSRAASSSRSTQSSSKGGQKHRAAPATAAAAAAAVVGDIDSLDEDFDSLAVNGKGARGRKKGRSRGAASAAAGQAGGKPPAAAKAPAAAAAAVAEDGSSSEEEGDEAPLRGRGSKVAAKAEKRKQKAGKKAQAAGAAAGMMCMVCSELFDSRSKLFKHIAATGHAALKQ